MADQQPVDADVYAERLQRLDRIGREALAAEPAEAISLVREANQLVEQLLPMHRRLMDELAHHRDALQAACDELAAETPGDRGGEMRGDRGGGTQGDPGGGTGTPPTAADQRLDRLDGVGDDGSDVPF